MSKREVYNKLIDEYAQTGLSRFDAACRVRREFPALAAQMVDEANARPPIATGTPSGCAAIAKWNERLEALVGRGMNRDKAVAKLGREEPELRQAYVDAVNAQRQPTRRRSA